MTSVQSDEPAPEVVMYEPEEALRRAKPLPPRKDLVIEGVTPEEWEAFRAAIADL